MKLMREHLEDVKILTEGKDGDKKYYIEGIFMQSEVKNRNGRIYPKGIMESAVNSFLPLIEAKRALGELGHPATPTINLERVSHIITDLKFEGNNIIGKARILEKQDYGRLAKNFLEEGVQLGVSSRAMGSLKNVNGVNVVQNDLQIATVDIVSDPSGPECFVNGIMEGAEWIFESGIWRQQTLEAAKTIIQKTPSKELIEIQARLFEQLLNSVK